MRNGGLAFWGLRGRSLASTMLEEPMVKPPRFETEPGPPVRNATKTNARSLLASTMLEEPMLKPPRLETGLDPPAGKCYKNQCSKPPRLDNARRTNVEEKSMLKPRRLETGTDPPARRCSKKPMLEASSLRQCSENQCSKKQSKNWARNRVARGCSASCISCTGAH